MPTVAVKKHFTFVGGLNTEAGPFTFPPNTWAEGDNVVPDIDGAVSLRLGIDYEPSYQLSGTTFDDGTEEDLALGCHEWNNVGGDGTRHFLVVQKGGTVEFYSTTTNPVSSTKKSFTIDLSDYTATGNTETVGVAPISCVSANGNLIIVSRDTDPVLVVYDPSDDSIDVSEIDIEIRDFVGVDDGLALQKRIATIDIFHLYNLYNQGWPQRDVFVYRGAGDMVFPSNTQLWSLGKDSNGDFSQAELDKQDPSTSRAPRGRVVFSAFNRDRASKMSTGTSDSFFGGAAAALAIATAYVTYSIDSGDLVAEVEHYRPTTCAFFAGRAWFAGVKSDKLSTWVMFSQVAETTDKLGRCYQEADPTSDHISDLVASDGGYIPIQDAGTILKLIPFGNSLLVIADNGVWQILGGLEAGFSADAYEVRKLSNAGCLSAQSVVETDNEVLFWSDDGIYIINSGQGGVAVQNVTAESIHTLFAGIPGPGKQHAAGVYVPHERVVYWAYNDDEEQDGTLRRFKKNRLLCLDADLKAFYTMTIEELASNSPYIVDMFVTKNSRSASSESNLLKFLTVHQTDSTTFDITFSEFDTVNDAPRKHRDWYTKDSAGSAFTGHVMPGYDFGAEQGGDKPIQALYVHVYMRRTETGIDANGDAINPSSCLMRGRWDWTDGSGGNRQGPQQQVYRHVRPFQVAAPSDSFDDGHPVVVTRNKLRGKGKALQLRFDSEADKDMQLLGWAITYIGHEAP